MKQRQVSGGDTVASRRGEAAPADCGASPAVCRNVHAVVARSGSRTVDRTVLRTVACAVARAVHGAARRTASRLVFGLGLAGAALGVTTAQQAAERLLAAQADAPRAYGHTVGDVVTRRVQVTVPEGLHLDADSLPSAGQRGRALELREVDWRAVDAGAGRYELRLRYQVFLSPPEARTFEMPTLRLRFVGSPRDQDLLIDAWPVSVAPLVPVEVSPRRGLGELQPDIAPPAIDTQPTTTRLALYGLGLAAGAAYLAVVYLGWPAWMRRQRPFGRAWRRLATLPATLPAAQWQAAARELHQALDATAGHTVFAQGVDAFIAQRPRFSPLREDLLAFFVASRTAFFGGDAGLRETALLRRLGRRARDIERGSA